MALLLRHKLQQRVVAIAADFISSSSDPPVVLELLRAQLIRYKEVRTPPTDPTGLVRRSWTGKVGGNRDDVVVALQLCVYWSNMFWQDSKYAPYWGRRR